MQKRISQFFTETRNKYGNYDRLCKLFKTDKAAYLYDVGTGKIMQLNQTEYTFLSILIAEGNVKNAIREMKSNINALCLINDAVTVMEQQKLFQAPVLSEFDIDPTAMLEKTDHELQQITLEVTQQCNMHCKYCIYDFNNVDFRNFGNKCMTWDIARKAIDYGLEHSGEKLAVTFYGGEPLLEAALIKHCVNYIRANSKGKNMSYSLTTNLTLMTRDLAEFFASIEEFAIVASIDGGKEIHNKYRVFLDGSGTFEKVMEGLKILVSAYGKNAERLISVSMVQAGVITGSVLEKNRQFFNSLKWLPPVNKRVSYVRTSSDMEIKSITESDKFGYSNPIGDWTLDTLLNQASVDVDDLYTLDFLDEHLSRIHNRVLTDQPYPKYALNGCCEPASRKLYISAEGNFHICERIGKSPAIGNADTGLDKSALADKYIKSYCKESMPKCALCWAIRFCNICYTDCFDDKAFRSDLKEIACLRTKNMIERELINYHTLLERKPEFLDRLNQLTQN